MKKYEKGSNEYSDPLYAPCGDDCKEHLFIDGKDMNSISIPLSNIATIKIKYHNPDLVKLQFIGGDKSDWVDLRAAEDVKLKAGEMKIISLGVSMELPKGYEAHVVPRSSTAKKFGIEQYNSVGVIDESYKGNSDIWGFPALAIRDTEIHVNDRICQFRIEKKQPRIEFVEVDDLGNENRGGFGSTGAN